MIEATSETAPLFILRAGQESDHPFIVDSWVKSYQSYCLTRDCESCGGSGRIYRGARFLRGHKRLIRDILARPTSALLIACHPDNHDCILGWAVTEPDVIHYVFVKRDVRRVGIAKALLAPFWDKSDIVYTHRGNVDMARSTWHYDHHRAFYIWDD